MHQAPPGYRWTSDGCIEKDPDLRVQRAIQLCFSKVKELGSVRQALVWLADHRIELPVGRRGGGEQGVVWKLPRYSQLLRLVRNPFYAGIYAWGKTTVSTIVEDGVAKPVRTRRKQQEWPVLIPDHHEPYLSREEFDEIQRMIDSNAQSVFPPGAPKVGRALLSGLIRCRRCGRKLQVNYGGASPPQHSPLRLRTRAGRPRRSVVHQLQRS